MKLKGIILALSLMGPMVTQAQTNLPIELGGSSNQVVTVGTILDEVGTAVGSATNWTVVTGGGTSLSGARRNMAFSDLVYDVSQNVGLVLGGDYMWSKTQGQFDLVKGGVTLQATIHPFAFLGGTNFLSKATATPFVSELLAQPNGGSSNIGNLTVMGAQVNLFLIKNFKLSVGGMVEKRQGQGSWDGTYALGEIGLTRVF